jgi:threonine aldolase
LPGGRPINSFFLLGEMESLNRHPRGFYGDHQAGVHPEVMEAILAANTGHVPSYGDDPYTERATAAFKASFSPDAEAYFVFNGSAANVLSIAETTRPTDGVICAETSHIYLDECGAPDKHAKLLPAPAVDGKISPASVDLYIDQLGNQHVSQPRLVSITQPTEVGTVYRPAEVAAVAERAHQSGLLLHMDGSRLPNAAAFLDCDLNEITTEVGVDILSFGGTKNGLLIGEAVVFLNPRLGRNFPFVRKQGLQLASKMRFISAQFEALLTNDLWRRIALHENAIAQQLGDRVRSVDGVEVVYPVEINAVFATLPSAWLHELRERFFFHTLDESEARVRWMSGFDSTVDDVTELSELLVQCSRRYSSERGKS